MIKRLLEGTNESRDNCTKPEDHACMKVYKPGRMARLIKLEMVVKKIPGGKFVVELGQPQLSLGHGLLVRKLFARSFHY